MLWGRGRRKQRIQFWSPAPCCDIQHSQQSLKTVPISQMRTLRHTHIRVTENHFKPPLSMPRIWDPTVTLPGWVRLMKIV